MPPATTSSGACEQGARGMKLWSESWISGERIPSRHAAGRVAAGAPVEFSDNLNPHFGWSDVPAGTQSFALICHDFDVPSVADDVNRSDREVPQDLPRVDFFHWVLVDLPPTLRSIAQGEYSHAFTPRGKPGPAAPHGARQGLNDYTSWFAGDTELAGNYFGYDGPFPPYNDALVHHYVFTLYALSVTRAPVVGGFTGHEARRAIHPHVLGEAIYSGTYTLNRRLLG
jgi:Raf kinase inhibitor-like YbhB/YbcL family protein